MVINTKPCCQCRLIYNRWHRVATFTSFFTLGSKLQRALDWINFNQQLDELTSSAYKFTSRIWRPTVAFENNAKLISVIILQAFKRSCKCPSHFICWNEFYNLEKWGKNARFNINTAHYFIWLLVSSKNIWFADIWSPLLDLQDSPKILSGVLGVQRLDSLMPENLCFRSVVREP